MIVKILTQHKICTALMAAPQQMELGSIFHLSPYELRPITAVIPYEWKILHMFQIFQHCFFTLHYGTLRIDLTCMDKWYITIHCSFLLSVALREGGKLA